MSQLKSEQKEVSRKLVLSSLMLIRKVTTLSSKLEMMVMVLIQKLLEKKLLKEALCLRNRLLLLQRMK